MRWDRSILLILATAIVARTPLCRCPASASVGGGPGLMVRADGVLVKDGAPYRGIGVNYFDAFSRTLRDHEDKSYKAGFKVLAEYEIPFARFMCTGFWPSEMKLYRQDQDKYFALLDGVIKAAEEHGIGLIPSLFWHMPTVPDLVGEPCDRWGNPDSRTHAFMKTYTREVVTRYLDSPPIWAWEFGNEYNLRADLPNAMDHLPAVVPQLGTPDKRTRRDTLTHEAVRTALREFALEVRRHDRWRMISTGNSLPRPSAWHQMTEGTWQTDTQDQFASMLAGDNPDPVDTLCVHVYPEARDRLGAAIEAAKRQRKPLFVGEFGAKGETAQTENVFQDLLSTIENRQVPLAALWVFDYGRQTDLNVTAENERSWQLKAATEANRRIRKQLKAGD